MRRRAILVLLLVCFVLSAGCVTPDYYHDRVCESCGGSEEPGEVTISFDEAGNAHWETTLHFEDEETVEEFAATASERYVFSPEYNTQSPSGSATVIDDRAVQYEFTDEGIIREGERDAMIVEDSNIRGSLEGIDRLVVEPPPEYEIGPTLGNAEREQGALVWEENQEQVDMEMIVLVPEDQTAAFVTVLVHRLSLVHYLVIVAIGYFVGTGVLVWRWRPEA